MDLIYYSDGVKLNRTPLSFVSRESYEHYKALCTYSTAVNDYKAVTNRADALVSLDALSKIYNVCYLIEFRPASGPVIRLTNYFIDVVVNGGTYIANNDINEVGVITTGNAINTKTVDVTFGGIDDTIARSDAVNYFKNCDVVIRQAHVLQSNGVCVSSQIVYRGIVGKIVHSLDPAAGKTGIKLSVENVFAELENALSPNTSPAVQQSKFPTDTLFQYSGRELNGVIWRQSKK